MSSHILHTRALETLYRPFESKEAPSVPIVEPEKVQIKEPTLTFPPACTRARPKLSVVVVKKRISSRFFALLGGKVSNPPPGTVIDTEVTRPEWWVGAASHVSSSANGAAEEGGPYLTADLGLLKVRLLHRQPSRQQRERLADTLQRGVRHQRTEARPHAAAHLQAVPHVFQLAGKQNTSRVSSPPPPGSEMSWCSSEPFNYDFMKIDGQLSLSCHRGPLECLPPASTPTNWLFLWAKASTRNQMSSWMTCCSTFEL